MEVLKTLSLSIPSLVSNMKDFSIDSLTKVFRYNNYDIKINVEFDECSELFSISDSVMYQEPETLRCFYGIISGINKSSCGKIHSLIILWNNNSNIPLSGVMSYDFAINNLIITRV